VNKLILFNKLNVQKTNLIENEGFVTFKFYWKNYKYHVSKKNIFYFIHVLRIQIWKNIKVMDGASPEAEFMNAQFR
jgi:hypothetical protein